jgi:hypothetical protein
VTGRFATTQWNVVLEARDGTESRTRLALESLCHAYWFSLYVYAVNRSGGAMEKRCSIWPRSWQLRGNTPRVAASALARFSPAARDG